MRSSIIFLTTFFLLGSCNSSQSKLDKAQAKIEYAEQNKKEMTSQDWSNLETRMSELGNDLELNRDKYSDEQVIKIKKIQGRYTALMVKKGLNTFKETIKDLGNQMEGFIEGVKSDNNKTNENE
jgi:hypothetical protein